MKKTDELIPPVHIILHPPSFIEASRLRAMGSCLPPAVALKLLGSICASCLFLSFMLALELLGSAKPFRYRLIFPVPLGLLSCALN